MRSDRDGAREETKLPDVLAFLLLELESGRQAYINR
jgi:hypothetical protein